MTPLMYAVKENRTSLIDRLIELGCDVCARNFVSIDFRTLHQRLIISIKLYPFSFYPNGKSKNNPVLILNNDEAYLMY